MIWPKLSALDSNLGRQDLFKLPTAENEQFSAVGSDRKVDYERFQLVHNEF